MGSIHWLSVIGSGEGCQREKEQKLPQVSSTWPLLRRGDAKSQGQSGKADQFVGFPNVTIQRFAQEE